MAIISFLLGVIVWSFLEYIIHRFLGHVHKGKNFFKSEHLRHHGIFAYFAPIYKKAGSALLVFGFLYFILSLLVPSLFALMFLLGFSFMYTLYEVTHFRFHARLPIAAPFVILRKHHFYHHFHNPKTNFGVTTRIWDRVFGTFTAVEKVRVPKRMAMIWLLEGEEIKELYAPDFYLA